MSNSTTGEFTKKFQKQKISVIGKEPTWMTHLPTAPVDIPSLVNRPTQNKTLEKHFKQAGGFDWCLWDPPKVGILPSGEKYLYDGDHSRHMYKMAFPTARTMPVAPRDMDTREDIHYYFAQINGGSRKNASAEEKFVHRFLSGDVKAEAVAKQLKACGLQIFCTDEKHGAVGDVSGPTVRYRGFTKSVKASSVGAVKSAVSLIKTTFKSVDAVHAELLEGLSIVLTDYPEVAVHGVYEKEFYEWFKANKVNEQGSVTTSWKNSGGAIHNKQGPSVARGILLDFVKKCAVKPKLDIARLGKRGV